MPRLIKAGLVNTLYACTIVCPNYVLTVTHIAYGKIAIELPGIAYCQHQEQIC